MSRWICLKSTNPVEASKEDPNAVIVLLPHPRTGTEVCFVIENNVNFLELQKVDSAQTRSWFVGNEVVKEGDLHIMSAFDPLYLLLPLLDESRKKTPDKPGRYVSLDDVLYNDQYPSLSRLSSLHALEAKLTTIADVQDVGGSKFWRLNDEKVVGWLKAKATLLLSKFDTYTFFEIARYHERNMSESEKQENRLRTVLRVISDCIPAKWSEMLMESYGLQPQILPDTTSIPMSVDDDPDAQKEDIPSLKRSASENKGKGGAKKKKLTPAQNALAKADRTGMKNIASFFGKK
ncbi:Ribonuclease H2 subunit B [Rhizophlyctis rosea]|nr:Ribonuclease H2 subunit B [Rhizophlyctis rosea]